MGTCMDCGVGRAPLCHACADTAAALGLSVDERLVQLGAPTLPFEGVGHG